MFIAMDDPEHGAQRKTVAPAFGPSEIAGHAVALRDRTARLLDSLPVGEAFDWVERVSIELTTSMIATLFDWPWDDRHRLPIWSDWTAQIDLGPDPEIGRASGRERVVQYV